MSSNSSASQFRRFIFVGLTTVLIDFIFYSLFIKFLSPSFSKAISFLIGSIYSYFSNKFFTFKSKNNSLRQIIKFFLVYFLSLLINVYINYWFISIFNDTKSGLTFAFLIAVSCSASFNFISMKKYVFKNA